MNLLSRYTHPGFCLFIIFLIISMAACNSVSSSDNKDEEYRQIAWNSLSDDQKATVIHDLNEAVVNCDDTYKSWNEGEEAQSVPAVSVRFNTDDDALLGPIVIYIDPDTKEVLGTGPRY